MQQFLKGRLDLVKVLADMPAAHYADLVLIVTAVLSACAARRWPGKGMDKRKFVELLVVYSPPHLHASWVSVPALINHGLVAESDTPYGRPGGATRIFCDGEIDMSIDEARTKYQAVPGDTLRKHCYASLIYEWLRCGYSHEYWHDDNVTHVPASRDNALVSYIGRSMNGERKRMVTFHLNYLVDLAQHHVAILPSAVSPRPSTWWIDQG